MDSTPALTGKQLLEQANARLEEFSQQTRNWMWETNALHQFVYFSQNIEELSDLYISDLLGTSRLELALQNNDEPHWQAHAEALIMHKPFKDFRYERKNREGETRHILVTGWPLFDSQGNFAGYRGIGRDETEEVLARRQQAEREHRLIDEVKRNRQELDIVLENMTQSIMLFDRDGNIFLNNRRTRDLLGFSDEEYDSVATIEDHLRLMARRGDFGDVDIEQEVKSRAHRLCKGSKGDKTYRIHLKSHDRYLLVTLSSLPDGNRILTHTDVTAEARKEIQLNEREQALSTVIDNIDYGVLFMDSELRAEVINSRFAEIWKMDPEFIDSRPSFTELIAYNRHTGIYPIDPADDEAWDKFVSEREKVARKGNYGPVEMARADGRYFEYSVVNLPAGRRMATYFEITERKRMELALKEANEVLEERVEERTRELIETQKTVVEQSRKALLGELVASLCHELRNPLNALNASMFVIRRKVIDEYPALDKTFDRSQRTIERCTTILNDLYDFALTGNLVMESISLKEWFENFLASISKPDNVQLHLETEPSLPVCMADAGQLARAVNKIIGNAVLAAGEHAGKTGQGQVSISLANSGGRLEIIIRDNGAGMSEDVCSKAFEPLFSTRGFGVGLGLPIARQIMERHGGGIELVSLEGEGTTVTLWLPLRNTPQSKAA